MFQLQATTRSGKAQMPWFSYVLTVSSEEGLIRPLENTNKSTLYCDPFIANLAYVTSGTKQQPNRITVFAEIIYMVYGDAAKVIETI